MIVQGTLIDAKGNLLKEVTLSFDPTGAPMAIDSQTLSKGLVKTNTLSDGTFSIELEPGSYIVRWDYAGTTSVLRISVPSDADSPQEFTDLIDATVTHIYRPTFAGSPTNANLSAATTYALFNGDVDASVTHIDYLPTNGGLDVNIATLETFAAPNLTTVAGSNYVTVQGAALTSASFPKLTSGTTINLHGNTLLEVISLPLLANLTVALNCYDNPALNEVAFGPVATCPTIRFDGCALPVETVNLILATLVASGWGLTGGTLDLSGGTNAAPTGQGITDKATLISQGATVTTN